MAHMECKGDVRDSALVSADALFELGMMHASGREGAVDLVAAHQWFNIAAARGHQDGARLRREIAEQMSDSEIGTAQRAARAWLSANAPAPAPVMTETRVAA